MKKIVLGMLIGATILSAEVQQKGIFVGIDYTKTKTTLAYYSDGGAITTNDYEQKVNENYLGYKIGYQYYFTRVYFRYNTIDYKDKKRDKFSLKGSEYEFNAEYLPALYTSKQKSWQIRGLVGAMAGYARVRAENPNGDLLPPNQTFKKQNNFLYGFQAGVMVQSEWGVNIEGGIRYKKGNLTEYADDKGNTAVLGATNREYFVGLNYLF